MFCSEHLEFQLPVGLAAGDFSEPTAGVGLELRRWRLRGVGHMVLTGGKLWGSRGVDEMWLMLVSPPRPVRRGSRRTWVAALLTSETMSVVILSSGAQSQKGRSLGFPFF